MMPEPPDGTRLEFEHWTDVYAIWRDDESSRVAEWKTGDGGWVWCLYGQSVPTTWAEMWEMFGESLETAIRLIPHPDDIHRRCLWPTQPKENTNG